MIGDTLTVPAGSRLGREYVDSYEVTDDGWLMRATFCGDHPEHEGPYVWHWRTPADCGGSATTDNIRAVCWRCEKDLTAFRQLIELIGPDEVGRIFTPTTMYATAAAVASEMFS